MVNKRRVIITVSLLVDGVLVIPGKPARNGQAYGGLLHPRKWTNIPLEKGRLSKGNRIAFQTLVFRGHWLVFRGLDALKNFSIESICQKLVWANPIRVWSQCLPKLESQSYRLARKWPRYKKEHWGNVAMEWFRFWNPESLTSSQMLLLPRRLEG